MSRSSAQALQVIRQWQSQTDAIREAPDPVGTRIGVWTVTILLVAAVVATPIVKIQRVVTSQSGKMVSSRPMTTVQSLDASLIKSVDVKEGQQVRKGQLLATLDPTFASADVGQLQQQVAGLDAQITRAKAELDQRPLSFGTDLPPEETPYVALQKSLFAQRQAQFDAQNRSFDERMKSTQATIVKQQGDELRYQAREKISHQVEGMRDTLYKAGASSLLSLLQASDARIELLRTLENGHNSLIESQHQMASIQSDRDAFVQNWRAGVAQELVTAQNQHDTASASLQKAARHEDLVRLTAPENSVVLTVSKLSVGSVLREGDQLMTLAPTGTPVEAEIHVSARDIGYLRPGDPVVLKILSLNDFEHGSADGTVSWISEGAFTTDADEKPVAAYYKARVKMDETHFTGVPSGFQLIPGMTLMADVKVGHRSIFSYILGGFLPGMGESMRDL